jgi:hypothetical protein
MIKNIQEDIVLIDAFPIMLCSGKRNGKVATEIADKTFVHQKISGIMGLKYILW